MAIESLPDFLDTETGRDLINVSLPLDRNHCILKNVFQDAMQRAGIPVSYVKVDADHIGFRMPSGNRYRFPNPCPWVVTRLDGFALKILGLTAGELLDLWEDSPTHSSTEFLHGLAQDRGFDSYGEVAKLARTKMRKTPIRFDFSDVELVSHRDNRTTEQKAAASRAREERSVEKAREKPSQEQRAQAKNGQKKDARSSNKHPQASNKTAQGTEPDQETAPSPGKPTGKRTSSSAKEHDEVIANLPDPSPKRATLKRQRLRIGGE